MTQRNLTGLICSLQIQGAFKFQSRLASLCNGLWVYQRPKLRIRATVTVQEHIYIPSPRVRLGKDDLSANDGRTMKALDQSTAQCEKPVKEKSAAIAWVRAQPIRHDFIRLYSTVWKPYVGISRTRIFVNRLRAILEDCEKGQGSISSRLLIGNRWSIVAAVSGALRLKCLTPRDISVARK